MNLNKVIITGNLTRDTELKYLQSGTSVCNFSIAVNEKYKDTETTSYFDVVTYGKQAELCNEYLSKGKPALIEGRLQQRRWEAKDGSKQSKIEITAEKVIFIGGN